MPLELGVVLAGLKSILPALTKTEQVLASVLRDEESQDSDITRAQAKLKDGAAFALCLGWHAPRKSLELALEGIAIKIEEVEEAKRQLESCCENLSIEMSAPALQHYIRDESEVVREIMMDAPPASVAEVVARFSDSNRRALRGNSQDANAWHNFGVQGGAQVAGHSYTEIECYQQALISDPTHAKAWYSLGVQGGAQVAGRSFSKIECYQQALTCNPKDANAWCDLGAEGGARVFGRTVSAIECYQQALACDRNHAIAWHSLGVEGGAEVAGRNYSSQECFQQFELLY